MVLYFIGVYIINRTLHGRLEIWNFSSGVEKIFHLFAVLTREIFFNTRRGHVISSIYFIQCSCFCHNSCTFFFTHTGFVHSSWWTIFSSLADERRASKPSWWARGVSYSSLCWSGNFMGLCYPDTSYHPTSRSWGLFSMLTFNNLITKLDAIGWIRKPVVLIRTQAVKLHKNFIHFKYVLHMNKKYIFGQNSSFFKPSMWNW